MSFINVFLFPIYFINDGLVSSVAYQLFFTAQITLALPNGPRLLRIGILARGIKAVADKQVFFARLYRQLYQIFLYKRMHVKEKIDKIQIQGRATWGWRGVGGGGLSKKRGPTCGEGKNFALRKNVFEGALEWKGAQILEYTPPTRNRLPRPCTNLALM
jgi:hypothetical protein